MSYPFIPDFLETQDTNDDDAIVIDELVQPTSAPADPHGAIVPVEETTQYKSKPVGRIQGATETISLGLPPKRLLGEDLDRKTCRVRVFSTAASPSATVEYVIIADNTGLIAGASRQLAITGRHGNDLVLDGHTGAVWVVAGPAITADIEVTAWGVTYLD